MKQTSSPILAYMQNVIKLFQMFCHFVFAFIVGYVSLHQYASEIGIKNFDTEQLQAEKETYCRCYPRHVEAVYTVPQT